MSFISIMEIIIFFKFNTVVVKLHIITFDYNKIKSLLMRQ